MKITTKLMDILIGIATGLILIGSLFKIQHYPYGNFLLFLGIITNFVLSGLEIKRLRQIIKENGYKE